jgi:hypothetical protein
VRASRACVGYLLVPSLTAMYVFYLGLNFQI